jgi:hypothetical protein
MGMGEANKWVREYKANPLDEKFNHFSSDALLDREFTPIKYNPNAASREKGMAIR